MIVTLVINSQGNFTSELSELVKSSPLADTDLSKMILDNKAKLQLNLLSNVVNSNPDLVIPIPSIWDKIFKDDEDSTKFKKYMENYRRFSWQSQFCRPSGKIHPWSLLHYEDFKHPLLSASKSKAPSASGGDPDDSPPPPGGDGEDNDNSDGEDNDKSPPNAKDPRVALERAEAKMIAITGGLSISEWIVDYLKKKSATLSEILYQTSRHSKRYEKALEDPTVQMFFRTFKVNPLTYKTEFEAWNESQGESSFPVTLTELVKFRDQLREEKKACDAQVASIKSMNVQEKSQYMLQPDNPECAVMLASKPDSDPTTNPNVEKLKSTLTNAKDDVNFDHVDKRLRKQPPEDVAQSNDPNPSISAAKKTKRSKLKSRHYQSGVNSTHPPQPQIPPPDPEKTGKKDNTAKGKLYDHLETAPALDLSPHLNVEASKSPVRAKFPAELIIDTSLSGFKKNKSEPGKTTVSLVPVEDTGAYGKKLLKKYQHWPFVTRSFKVFQTKTRQSKTVVYSHLKRVSTLHWPFKNE